MSWKTSCRSEKLCTFCLKICTSTNAKGSANDFVASSDTENENAVNEISTVSSLAKFLESFTGERIKAPVDKMLHQWKGVGCCEDCRLIINSLCSIYHQLKCLELQLEWKLGTLVNTMKLANRIPSRGVKLKNFFEADNNMQDDVKNTATAQLMLLNFHSFRRDLMKTCAERLSTSKPRIFLRRFKAPNNYNNNKPGVEIKSASHPEINDDIPIPFEAVHEQSDDTFEGSQTNCPADTEIQAPTIRDQKADSADSVEKSPNISIHIAITPDDVVTKIESHQFSVPSVVTKNEHGAEFPMNCAEGTNDQSPAEQQDDDFFDCFSNPEPEESPKNEFPVSLSAEALQAEATTLETEVVPIITSTHRLNFSFSCEACSKGFNQKWLLKRHVTTQHGKNKSSRKETTPAISALVPSPTKITIVEPNPKHYEHDVTKVGLDSETPLIQSAHQSKNEALSTEDGHPAPKRYSFRERRKRSFVQVHQKEEDIESNGDDFTGSKCQSSSPTSSSCESDTQSRKLNTKNRPTGNSQKIKEDLVATDANFKCQYCNKKLRNQTSLKIHEFQFHAAGTSTSASAGKRLALRGTRKRCSFENCSEIFDTYLGLETHKNLHGSYKCNFCEITKDHPLSLAVHETEHALRETIPKTKSGKKISKTKPGKKILSCARCPDNFFSKHGILRHYLKLHLNLSTKLPVQTCSICSSKSRGGTEDYFREHYKIYHKTDDIDPSDIQRCKQCPAYFVKSEQLTNHLINIHFNKTCPECGRLFSGNPYRLRDHIERAHPFSDSFPHLVVSCAMGDCKRKFATEAELKRHQEQDRHHDPGFVKCLKCNKDFKGEGKLKIHMNYVHGDKAFICPKCGKGFNSKGVLDVHQEYHKDPKDWKFQCDTCGKRCPDKHKLSQHQRTHSNVKLFVCQLCGEKYAHRHNWLNHMRRKHKREFSQDERVISSRNYLSRKGSKKGDCITTGANVAISTVEEGNVQTDNDL